MWFEVDRSTLACVALTIPSRQWGLAQGVREPKPKHTEHTSRGAVSVAIGDGVDGDQGPGDTGWREVGGLVVRPGSPISYFDLLILGGG